MAVTRRDLGNIIQGFGGGFFPVKFQQERIQRQKLSDRQNFLTRIGEQIREGFLTEEQLIPHAKALEQEYGDTPEQALTSLRQYLPTESQRGSEIRRRLGDDPRLWTRELAGAIAGDVGRPEYFQARRALPSTSIVGGYDPETGALSTRPEPLTSTQTIGAGFDPSDRSYDPRLRDVRTTGKMFAPLVAQPQAERPFVPGATGGTPLEWGGPQADIFEGIQKEAILKESEQEARLREYRGEALRETLGITEEMHRKFFPRQLEDQILEIEALAPVKRQEMLEDLREELSVRRADDRMRLEGPYAKAVEEQQERLAIISAYVNDRPEWIERRNPQTGEPVIYAVTRDWKTGQLRFSDVTGSFGGTELWYGGTSQRGGQLESLLMSSVVTGLSSEGENADPRSREGQENILKAAEDIGLNPGFVLQWMESAQGQLNEPPGVRGGDSSVISQENLPPISVEDQDRINRKFFGKEDADQPSGTPDVPFSEYERIMSESSSPVIGTREVQPGSSGLTFNPAMLGQTLGLNTTSPRDIQAFQRQEGVVDWLTNQSRLDPRITTELLHAMLRDREGFEILRDAWASSRKNTP